LNPQSGLCSKLQSFLGVSSPLPSRCGSQFTQLSTEASQSQLVNLHVPICVLFRQAQLGFLSSPACVQGSNRTKRAAGEVVFVLRFLKGGGLDLLIIVMYTFTVTFSPQYIVLLSSFYQLTLKHKAIIKGGWSPKKSRKINCLCKTSANIGNLQAQSLLEICRYVICEFEICGPQLFED
jgi:hypothetical protein